MCANANGVLRRGRPFGSGKSPKRSVRLSINYDSGRDTVRRDRSIDVLLVMIMITSIIFILIDALEETKSRLPASIGFSDHNRGETATSEVTHNFARAATIPSPSEEVLRVSHRNISAPLRFNSGEMNQIHSKSVIAYRSRALYHTARGREEGSG